MKSTGTYNRFCKRCGKIYKTTCRTSKSCDACKQYTGWGRKRANHNEVKY